MKRRVFASIEERDGCVVARIYVETADGEAEYVAYTAAEAQVIRSVLRLLSSDRDLRTALIKASK